MNVYAQFEYKCRRCGQVVDGPSTAGKNASMALIGVITGAKPEPMLSMVSIHSCDIGGEGVTDLIGYRLEANLYDPATELRTTSEGLANEQHKR